MVNRDSGDDFSRHSVNNLNNLEVQKGDRIYFRLQSIEDGRYDQVSWDPEIKYINYDDIENANNLSQTTYRASTDFAYAGRGGEIMVPYTGVIHLAGNINKKDISSDDIEINIYKNGSKIKGNKIIFNETGSIAIDQDIQVEEGDSISIRIGSDSKIDLRIIEPSLELYYTSVENENITAIDDDGNPTIAIQAIYDMDNYAVDDFSNPYSPLVAEEDGVLIIEPELSVVQEIDTGEENSDNDYQKDTGEVNFVVKKPMTPLVKESIKVNAGNVQGIEPITVEVFKNEKLYLSFNARNPYLRDYINDYTVWGRYGKEVNLDENGNGWQAVKDGKLEIIPKIIYNTAGDGSEINGILTLKVFNTNGEELLSSNITVEAGEVIESDPMILSILKGEGLSFKLSSTDPDLLTTISKQVLYLSYPSEKMELPAVFNTTDTAGFISSPYRGWSYFAYNGNNRTDQPINESDLELNVDEIIDENGEIRKEYVESEKKAYVMYPNPADEIWASADDNCWIAADSMSSSRKGIDSISLPVINDTADVRAIAKRSYTFQSSYGGGIGPASASTSESDAYGKLDFIDINGDRFPDILGSGKVQFSTMSGGLEDINKDVAGLSGDVRKTTNQARNVGLGGNAPLLSPNSRGEVGNSIKGNSNWMMASIGINVSLENGGSSETAYDLIDMNGDGLVDRVSKNGSGLMVSLNMGYNFSEPEYWGSGNISRSETENAPLSLNQ